MSKGGSGVYGLKGQTYRHSERGVVTVKRDRPVTSLTVPCPVCKADVGEPCQTPHPPHRVRRRMAVRLLNEMSAS